MRLLSAMAVAASVLAGCATQSGEVAQARGDCRAEGDFSQTSDCLRARVAEDERVSLDDRALTLAYLDAVGERVQSGQMNEAQADAALRAFEQRIGRPIAPAPLPPPPSFTDDPLASIGHIFTEILPAAGGTGRDAEALAAGETLTIEVEGGTITCERRAYAVVTCS